MLLRLIALVFFCLEVFSPLLLTATDAAQMTASDEQAQIADHTVSVDFFTQLFFEEAGKEGKEGKETYLFPVCLALVFSNLQKFQPVSIHWKLPYQQFDTQPALFTLHRMLII